jgi:hypothetical protein
MEVCHDLPMTATPAPTWWTKDYTLVLGLVVVGNIVADFFADRVIDVNRAWLGPVVGCQLAQTFLMGFWLAFGGLHVLTRFALVAFITLAGTCATNFGLDDQNPLETLRALVVLGGTIVLGTHAVLMPMRWLFGWRVDFDRAYRARPSDRTGQFRLIHLLALTTAWALPFAIARLVPSDKDFGLMMPTFAAMGLVGSFPVAMVLLATRRQWLWALVAVGIIPLASIAESLTMVSGEDWLSMALVNVAIAMTLTIDLGILRLAGLRLFSVNDAAPTPGRDPRLAQLVDAWPSLPEATRQAIAGLIGRG